MKPKQKPTLAETMSEFTDAYLEAASCIDCQLTAHELICIARQAKQIESLISGERK